MRIFKTSLGIVAGIAVVCAEGYAQAPNIIWKRQQNSDRINSVIFNPAGDTLIAGSSDRLIKFWRVSDGALLKTLNSSAAYVHESAVESLSITADGRKLASASYQVVKLWTLPEGTVKNLYSHTDWVVGVAFSPNGSYLASASFDHTVKIWRPSDGVLMRTLRPPTERLMRAVAFSPNSTLLAGAGGDDTIHIWQTSDWREVRQLRGHADDIYTLTFSPDGTKIATGGYDRTVKVWNVATGALLYTLPGNGYVYGVAFTPDGTKLAYTDGEGSTIRVHRVSDGVRLQLYTSEVNEVQTVAFSRTGLLGYGRVDATTVLASIGTTSVPPPPTQTNWVLKAYVSGSGAVSASPWPNGYNGTYTNGTIVRLTASPNTGNKFVRWEGSVTGTNSVVSLTMNGNKTVTAYFAPTTPTNWTLKVNVSGGGSVSAAPAPNAYGGTYTSGTIVRLTASANSGNKFVRWDGSVISTNTVVSLTMNGNKTVTAYFAAASVPTSSNSRMIWHTSDRKLLAWTMNGMEYGGQYMLRNGWALSMDWNPTCLRDFDRDGYKDLLLQHTNGMLSVHFMNSTDVTWRTASIRNGTRPTAGWQAVAAADFNRDGWADVLFEDKESRTAVWYLNGTNFISSAWLRGGYAAGQKWDVRGVGDFNRDGYQDLLWQHERGNTAVWYMQNTTLLREESVRNGSAISAGWHVRGAADFNRDGEVDILIQHNDGRVVLWLMSRGDHVQTVLLQQTGPSWARIIGMK